MMCSKSFEKHIGNLEDFTHMGSLEDGPTEMSPTVLKEFLSLWGFGEVWGIFPGYVGKIID